MSARRIEDSHRVQSLHLPAAGMADPTSWPSVGVVDESKEPAPRDPHEVEREAFEKGFAVGEKAGLQMAVKKNEAVLKRFSQSMDELLRLREEMMQSCERDLVALSVEIARKLVGREISLDEKIVATFVRVAMEKLEVRGRATISLNPLDCEFMRKNLDQVLFDQTGLDITLKAREDLRRGDCIIESEYGHVDGRIAEQLREIEDGLLGF